MATTVSNAFTEFRRDYVDIDGDKATRARTSRDYLVEQLKSLGTNDAGFPPFTGGIVPFGSFSRNTKIQPLDDIDLLLLLNGAGAQCNKSWFSSSYNITISDRMSPLRNFLHDNSTQVSSIRILNKLKSSLAGLTNYKKAEIHRNQEAATLSMKSYDWTFDIVPAFPIGDSQGGTAYYVIPDGSGHWKATDPRIDQKRVTDCNQGQNGHLLPLIRLLKYWNDRTTKPVLGSYYFENLVINVFASRLPMTSPKHGMKIFLDNGSVWSEFPDPKGHGPSLNGGLDFCTKRKVSAAMSEAATWAGNALAYEDKGDHANAIAWWGKVFGGNFPTYTR